MSVNAQNENAFALGITGSYGNVKHAGGDLYLKLKKPNKLFGLPTELRTGVYGRTYQLDFAGIKHLNAESIGIFGDLIIFPVNGSGFFTGVRAEPLNFNWVKSSSRDQFRQDKQEDVADLYTGSSAFLQIGYKLNLTKSMALRLYGQAGGQQFTISNGDTFGNYTQNVKGEDIILENQLNFMYNLNLGIEFRL